MQKVKIGEVKPNPNNPRKLDKQKFQKLVQSIKDFPEMLEKRPLVVADGVILGGNMRHKAAIEAGLKEIPIIDASEWTDKQKEQFIIKDNLSFGEWDWDVLANEWDAVELGDWGMDVWKPSEEPDYSILDEEDLDDELADMVSGTRKAIQIEFEPDHYEEAQALIKFWREQEAYVGGMIIEHLRSAKKSL